MFSDSFNSLLTWLINVAIAAPRGRDLWHRDATRHSKLPNDTCHTDIATFVGTPFQRVSSVATTDPISTFITHAISFGKRN